MFLFVIEMYSVGHQHIFVQINAAHSEDFSLPFYIFMLHCIVLQSIHKHVGYAHGIGVT